MSRTKISNFLVIRTLVVPLVAIFLLFSAGTSSAAGQKRREAFRAVPANLRPQLINKLNLYVLLRSTRQWGKLYDLYSQRYVARKWPPLGLSRAEFIQGNQQDDAVGRNNLLGFKADRVQYIPETDDAPARVFIRGCGEYYMIKKGRRVGRGKRLKSVIEALYENGQWQLTDVIVDYRCEECEADRCRMN